MSRRRFLQALLLAATGCGKAAPLPPRLQRLVSIGSDFGEGGPADERFAAAELRDVAERVKKAAEQRGAAPSAAHLTHVLFSELGFEREIEDTALEFVLVPAVLRARRGSCVGLGSVYLAVAELLGLTCSGVLLSGHFFVRVTEQGRSRNVELLRRGEAMPDSWYAERYPTPGPVAAYGRPLSADEVLGVIEYDIGNERRRRGRLPEARRAYQRAVQHFPELGEARASLGAVLHLSGELDRAIEAYRRAEQSNPFLPGLARNIELLEREKSALGVVER